MDTETREHWKSIAWGLVGLAVMLIGEVVCYVLFPNLRNFTP